MGAKEGKDCIFDRVFYCIFKDFIYLFLEREEGTEKEVERNSTVPEITLIGCLSHTPLTGDLARNPYMCLTGNKTGHLSVPRPVLNPLSYVSQGSSVFFI